MGHAPEFCFFQHDINYHFVWIPKTRAKILVEPFKSDIKRFLIEECAENKWEPLALQLMPDHVHFFISAEPKWSPSVIIQRLKANSSRLIRKKYSIIREFRYTPDFWASGFYVGTAGHVTAENVARYIAEQDKKLMDKWDLFDSVPFEYDIIDGKVRCHKSQRLLTDFFA